MARKRAMVVAIATAIALVTAGCGGNDDARKPEPVDSQTSARPALEAAPTFPDSPTIDVEWQNTVVDVHPTSRFRDPVGGNDIAEVETVLGLAEEPDSETEEFFKDLDGVETEFEGKLARMSYSFEIEPQNEAETTYGFEMAVPVEFAAEFEKNDDVSAVVLLPRSAEEYDDASQYAVELNEDFEQGDLSLMGADESGSNRITISLYERTDPLLPPIWNYIPL